MAVPRDFAHPTRLRAARLKSALTRCFDRSESARGTGELPDGAGRNDGAVLRVGLVVLLDVAEVVEVVDHQSAGLAAAAIGEIGRPIEPFQAGAVADVETGDR